MNIIIRLIVEIFQAIFEKDAAERSQRQRQSRQGPPPIPRQGQRQGGGRARDLDAWIEDLVDDELPETRQPTRPPPRQRSRPLNETFAEHSAATMHSMDALDRHVDAYLGDSYVEIERHREFVLPGNNPMVQLVLAREIFGPPKGRR